MAGARGLRRLVRWGLRHGVPRAVMARRAKAGDLGARSGIRFLDILFPPENSALLTVGLPARHQGRPDSVGVPMFRTHEMRPGWVPPLPRGGGVLPTGAASPIGACRFPTASPIPR